MIDSLAAALHGVGFGPLQVSVMGLLAQDGITDPRTRWCVSIGDALMFSVEVGDGDGMCVC